MDQYINTKDIRNTFEHLTDEYAYTEFLSGIYVAETWIEDIESVDAEPVRHGHWIEKSYFPDGTPAFICSRCGRAEPIEEPYCNCGAKMDENSYLKN